MRKTIKKSLSFLLVLTMIVSLCGGMLTASAEGTESETWNHDTFALRGASATVDGTADVTVDVPLVITLNENPIDFQGNFSMTEVDPDHISYFVPAGLNVGYIVSELETTYLSLTNLISDYFPSTGLNEIYIPEGKILYSDGDLEGIKLTAGSECYKATYTIDKDTPSGEYIVAYRMEVTENYDFDKIDNSWWYATITVTNTNGPCTHANTVTANTANGNGTHTATVTCDDCEEVVSTTVENCTYVDHVCSACGAAEPSIAVNGTVVYKTAIDAMLAEVEDSTMSFISGVNTNEVTAKFLAVSTLLGGAAADCCYDFTAGDYTKHITGAEIADMYIYMTDTGYRSAMNGSRGAYWVSGLTAITIVDEHSYDDGAVTTAATCGADGVKTYTCSVCGNSYTEVIPATGEHTRDAATETYTDNEDGTHTVSGTCSVCGHTYTVVENHDFTDGDCACGAKAPTYEIFWGTNVTTDVNENGTPDVQPGDTVVATIYVKSNSDTVVMDAIDAALTYDATKLSYVSYEVVSANLGTANSGLWVTPNTDGTIRLRSLSVKANMSKGTDVALLKVTFTVKSDAAYNETAQFGFSGTPNFTKANSVIITPLTTGTAAVEVYGEYTLTVNYAGPDDGTFVAPETHTETLAVGAAYSVASPAVAGYTPDVAAVTGNMVAGGATVTVTYAADDHTITWAAGDGKYADVTNSKTTTVANGQTPAAPEQPTREGYTFEGWTPAIAVSTGDVTYTATWAVVSYDITWVFANGAADQTDTYEFGAAVTAPEDPTKEGYTFAGWDKTVPATMPAEDMTITATWNVVQYTITFNTNGGTDVAAITADFGANVTAPAAPTKEGYTFAGWDAEIPATMPAEDMTINANWNVNQYTITFDSNGGTDVDAITDAFGATVTAPAAPTKEGYTFAGWTPAVPATMPATDMTVTAQWNIKAYTISWDYDGDGAADDTTSVNHGVVPTHADPVITGKSFIGWDKTIVAATGDATYTALWNVAATFVTEEYKYAQTNDVLLIVADMDSALGEGEIYFYNGQAMYYTTSEYYIASVPGAAAAGVQGVYVTLIARGTANTAIAANLTKGTGAAINVTRDCDVNGDAQVNIFDASHVYQMLTFNGSYFPVDEGLNILDRLEADTSDNNSGVVYRGNIADVEKIITSENFQ